MPRYTRQEAIPGWDQSRLKGATLAIAGSGPTAFLAGLMAAAMGFGRLVLVGCGAVDVARLPAFGPPSQNPAASWARFFRKINPL